MAKVQGAALDEIQFRRPDVLQYWGGVHADSVHGYIRESPFFDHSSKNGLLWDQAQNDPRTFEVCRRRDTLEARLKSLNGLEYLIVGEAQPSADPALQGADTGVWVVRKQDRTKRAGREDEITILGTYYIVGENMYQAPSVYDIVGNHLMSAMTSLSKFMDQATPLPIFTPAVGYTYHPPAPAKTTTTQALQSQSFTSRENSIGPISHQPSQRSSSIEPASQITTTTTSSDPRDAALLGQSLRLMLAYGDEYMDENPLQGEPGNFVYAHTKERVRARHAEAEAAAAKAKEKEQIRETDDKSKSTTPAAFTSTADKIKSEAGAETKPPVNRKGSKNEAGGKKRRKSKANLSPITPTTGSSPMATRSPSMS